MASKQRLGERVIALRKKVKEFRLVTRGRYEYLKTNDPTMIDITFKSFEASFESHSPFLEATLLIAWIHDQEKCKNIVLNSCIKVLSAPIVKEELQWFMQYVFTSRLWVLETKDNKYMYEELLNITNNMAKNIMENMNAIYNSMENDVKWNQMMNIRNESIIPRQDDEKVGLLREAAITDIADSKEQDENVQTFVDSTLCVNSLRCAAAQLNDEFQNYMRVLLSAYGKVSAGPMKNVEWCQSKLENDYQCESFPKAAKLIDVIRCSVTFSSLDRFLEGYNAFMKHMHKRSCNIELARIKNGFLDENREGYRDVKVNVMYKSVMIDGLNMICEVQFVFASYLFEKQKIHRLYTITQQELYFKMTVMGIDSDTEEKEQTTQ